MKKITYLPIIILLAACGGKSTTKDTKKDDKVDETVVKTEQQIFMENKIMAMKTFHQEVVNGKPDTSKSELQELKEFDANGNVIKTAIYGGAEFRHSYKYNNDGKLASFDLTDGVDRVIRHYELAYENGLNTTKKITGPKGDEIATITHKYDKKGNLVEMVNEEKDSSQNSRETYTYDDKGRQTNIKSYNNKNVLKEETTTTYSSDNTYEEARKFYSAVDAPVSETTTKIKINKNKQILSREIIDNPKTGVGSREVYEYDANGLLTGIWIYDLPENKATGYKKVEYTKF